MSEELRECPFCGGTHSINVINFITGDSFRKCDICRAEAPETKTPEEAAEKWNTRPAEDALKAEVEELRYIVEQFSTWYNEGGCPKCLNPDFPCSAEQEYKDDPETEGDFDERDCWKEEHEHGCWVEYYRWKYRQKNNTPDTGKGGENE
jgi:hypothetical protein